MDQPTSSGTILGAAGGDQTAGAEVAPVAAVVVVVGDVVVVEKGTDRADLAVMVELQIPRVVDWQQWDFAQVVDRHWGRCTDSYSRQSEVSRQSCRRVLRYIPRVIAALDMYNE